MASVMNNHEIVVCENDTSGHQWRRLWKSQQFRNWEDAHDFLDRYSVRIRTTGGRSHKFVMIFPNEYVLAEFVLAWMCDPG
jgi:hypothetical protein